MIARMPPGVLSNVHAEIVRDGLGLPSWAGTLIAGVGTTVAGAVASRLATGGERKAQQQTIERSLVYDFQLQQMQMQQESQIMTMAMVGVAGLAAVMLLR